MRSPKSKYRKMLPLLASTGIVMITTGILKLAGVIIISWWKVSLPVLLPVIFLLVVLIGAVLYIILDTFILTPIKRRIRDHRIIRDQREQRKRRYKL